MNRFSKAPLWALLFFLAVTLCALVTHAGGAPPAPICKKELPEITLKNLTPPYRDYAYFQIHELFPFEARATSFSLINAWWLAEASTLVYADQDFVTRAYAKAGLKVRKFLDHAGTQGFVAGNDRFAIVAFRGSQIWKRREGFDPRQMLEDIRTNIDIRMANWDRGGRVHLGFKSALDNVWNELAVEVAKLQAQDIPVWFTGHSQGAALAALAADRLPEVQGVYTFGSPRVGDQEFQQSFHPQAFRVVNGSDIVTSVPPGDFYRHVGELKPLIQQQSTPGWSDLSAPPGDSACPRTATRADGAKSFHSGLLIPDAVRDHVPLLYAIRLWNELVDSLNAAAFTQHPRAPKIDAL